MSNNTEALNKRERNYLRPAIVFGWRIEIWPHRKDGLWDGDNLTPVKVGKMAESLIERGYLERAGHYIRATRKSEALKCRSGSCVYGIYYDMNDEPAGKCPECEDGIRREASND